ncbi:MAG: hypothetical protein LUF84_08220 [Clostridiales bacterium]|nr:hypothetical protein [Clostridiales bacterium]
MKLNPKANVVAFLQDVSNCKGQVFFSTKEGDLLNLSSTLSQYVFAVITAKPELLATGQVVCTEPSDASALAAYLTEED